LLRNLGLLYSSGPYFDYHFHSVGDIVYMWVLIAMSQPEVISSVGILNWVHNDAYYLYCLKSSEVMALEPPPNVPFP